MPDTGPESWLGAPAEQAVDAPIVCVITRFGLRGARHLLPTRLDYRSVVQEARSSATPGLLRSAFLVEDSRTCYSLSIWESPDAIPRFGADVHSHVRAARRVFGRLAFDPDRGPELWSAKWRLVSVSNNLNWSDFDLRGTIESSGVRGE